MHNSLILSVGTVPSTIIGMRALVIHILSWKQVPQQLAYRVIAYSIHSSKLFRCVDTNNSCRFLLSSTAAVRAVSSWQLVSGLFISGAEISNCADLIHMNVKVSYPADICGLWEDTFFRIDCPNALFQSQQPHGLELAFLLLPKRHLPSQGHHMLYHQVHQIWWITRWQELQRKIYIRWQCQHTIFRLTTARTTFREKVNLRRCEGPAVVHRNAVPVLEELEFMHNFRRFIYHIACTWRSSFFSFERRETKSFTASNSAFPPASKPWESWKMNPGLLRNTISFSISWSPRWPNTNS